MPVLKRLSDPVPWEDERGQETSSTLPTEKTIQSCQVHDKVQKALDIINIPDGSRVVHVAPSHAKQIEEERSFLLTSGWISERASTRFVLLESKARSLCPVRQARRPKTAFGQAILEFLTSR